MSTTESSRQRFQSSRVAYFPKYSHAFAILPIFQTFQTFQMKYNVFTQIPTYSKFQYSKYSKYSKYFLNILNTQIFPNLLKLQSIQTILNISIVPRILPNPTIQIVPKYSHVFENIPTFPNIHKLPKTFPKGCVGSSKNSKYYKKRWIFQIFQIFQIISNFFKYSKFSKFSVLNTSNARLWRQCEKDKERQQERNGENCCERPYWLPFQQAVVVSGVSA